jgi:tetratricopeptide (TPR) repeat protein
MLSRAFELFQSGALEECETLCVHILADKSSHHEAAHYLLGLIRLIRGDYSNSADHLTRFIGARAYEPDAYDRLSIAYRLSGQHAQAIRASACAIVLRPDFQDSYHHLAATLGSDSTDGNVTAWRHAYAIDPMNPLVMKNYGAALVAANSFEHALPVLHAALTIDPACMLTRYNLAMTAYRLADYNQATPFGRQSAADRPDDSEAWLILAGIAHRLGRWQAALDLFRRSEFLGPHMPAARLNQALLLLTLGDFARGLELHEARLETSQVQAPPETVGIERLNALHENHVGKSILVWAEQGLGDTIQFCRYLRLMSARGLRVTFLVQAPLKDLMSRLDPSIQVVAQGDPIGQFDFHCPLMSLPLLFRTSLLSVPDAAPYLTGDPDQIARWRAELGLRTRRRIGIIWAGNPAQLNDRNRSMPLSALRPLLGRGDIDFHSLKPELTASERDQAAAFPNLIIHPPGRMNMMGTAALIETLDLVISVDTSIAHLAGALAKPVWIMLPFVPDWRWLLDRHDSPWYRTARLFRQGEEREWRPVISKIAENLSHKFTVL